jgi:hypothetical protein
VNAMLAAELNKRQAGVMLSEDRDDLRLGEARRAHKVSFSAFRPGKPTVLDGPAYRGGVKMTIATLLNS